MKRYSLVFILIITTLTGCSLQAGPQNNPDPIYTSAAQTIAATLTYGANLAALSTQQPIPTWPSIESPTENPIPAVPSPIVIFTPVVVSTPIPTINPTATKPSISSTVNTNCREGPGSDWDVLSGLMVGDKVAVLGRLSANNWYLVEDPDDSAGSCWVWSRTTVIDGNIDSILIVTPPPSPIPAFTVSASLNPATFTGPCPVVITLNGAIKTDMATEVTYHWSTSFGSDFANEAIDFDEAGKKNFSDTLTITEDTDGSIRFRITEPYDVKSDKVTLKVNCE